MGTGAQLMLWVITGIIILNYLLSLCLTLLNRTNITEPLPQELEGLYDAEKYKLSQQYEKDKVRLSLVSDTFLFLLSFLFLVYGGYGWLDGLIRTKDWDTPESTIVFFGILALASDWLSLPFQWYSTFVLEEKYGFNRTTAATFITDKIKGYLLAAMLGGSLLYLFVLFYEYAGNLFWVYSLAAFSVFMLLMNLFYTTWILPFFNKLAPLPNGETRTAIEHYCHKNNFTISDLMVMDGSKRSSKANAFFSGMGSRKKIVLFDTLVNNYTTDELVAVLAHEVGHYKKKHTVQGLILAILQLGIMLFLLSLFLNNSIFSEALGSETYSLPLSLTAFTILYTPLSTLIGIGMNMVSRKNEFEADAFAKSTFKGEALISALKKLSSDSLSNLTPHPLYVFFYYSHPPLYQRIRQIEEL